MAERAATHIVGDLGLKLANDAGAAGMRAIALLWDPRDQFDVIDIGICSLLALHLASFREANPEKSVDECVDIACANFRFHLLKAAQADRPTSASRHG